MTLPFTLSHRDTIPLGRVGPLGLWPYRIPVADRQAHFYCIGTTGQGKSKFLEGILVSDIQAGRGCGLVDPHTDLARDTLAHLLSDGYFDDADALQRVIYFDPTRTDYLLPFNVLKAPFPPYVIAQQVIEAFRRAWPHSLEEAPRFSNLALATLLVLLETGLTLVDMPLVLTNKDFREQLLQRVRDPQVVEFFRGRFELWGRDRAVMIESVLNKVTAFTLNPYLRRCLGTEDNRLDFRKIMDEGQVLIVDLGNCDGETRRLLGGLIVTGMEMAALSRKDSPSPRRPFYLFLDEFQDFCANDGAAKTLAQILSECRKFGLHLHLAHQVLRQVQDRVSSALGNVGIKVVFAVDREDAEILARKLFRVDTERVKHDAQTDTQHPLFSPLMEQWEQAVAAIQALPPRVALVKRRGVGLVRIRTETIHPYRATRADVDDLQTRLAQFHGMPVPSTSRPPLEAVPPQTPVRLSDWEAVTSPSHTVYEAGA